MPSTAAHDPPAISADSSATSSAVEPGVSATARTLPGSSPPPGNMSANGEATRTAPAAAVAGAPSGVTVHCADAVPTIAEYIE